MTQTEILQEFKGLTLAEQLETLRVALGIVEANFRHSQMTNGEHLPLAEAAALLLEDYMTDEELISFTALDGEDLHAAW